MKCGCFFTLIPINCPTHLGSQSMQTSLFKLLVLAPCFDCIILSMMCGLILCIHKTSFLCQPLKSHLFYPIPVRLVIWTRYQPSTLHYWPFAFPINTSILYILCWKSHSKHLWRNSFISFKSSLKTCLVSDYLSFQFCTGYRENFFCTASSISFLNLASVSLCWDNSPAAPCWSKDYRHHR